MSSRIVCFATEEAWVQGATDQIVARLRAALAARRRAAILLAGGSTPIPIYRALARAERIDWERVHFFWGDERMVPPDHPESNFRMAREQLLEPLGIGPDDSRVHRFPTELGAREAADMYEQNLRLFFDITPEETPIFDIVLLGMGEDGHTASLFPETEALAEERHLAVANPVPRLDTTRLTVTFRLINAARCTLILVKGGDKAARLAEVLEGVEGQYPVQRVQPSNGDVVWVVDRVAAERLAEGNC